MADRFTIGFKGERHKGERVGTLWNDKRNINGDVTLVEGFDELDDIAKHDLLDDWIALLTHERNVLHEKMYGFDED